MTVTNETQPIRYLSVGDVFSVALRIYWANFFTYSRLAFIALLWLLIPIYGAVKSDAIICTISRLAFHEVIAESETTKHGCREVNSRLWKFFVAKILLVFLTPIPIIGFFFFLTEEILAIEDNIRTSQAIARSFDLIRSYFLRFILIILTFLLFLAGLILSVFLLPLLILFIPFLQCLKGVIYYDFYSRQQELDLPEPDRLFKKVSVLTSKGTRLHLSLAGIGDRFCALAIDFVIVSLTLLIFLPIAFSLLGVLTQLILLLIPAYFIGFETAWQGQTPGKRLVKIQVVRDNGKPIQLKEAALRTLLFPVDIIAGIGAFLIFFGKKEKRLGDIVSGTIVIKTEATIATEIVSEIEEEEVADTQPIATAVEEEELADAQPIATAVKRKKVADAQPIATAVKRKKVADAQPIVKAKLPRIPAFSKPRFPISKDGKALGEELIELADVSLLEADKFAAIQDYLQKRQKMTKEKKTKLSQRLAGEAKKAIALDTLPRKVSATVFLEAVYFAYQQQDITEL